MAAAFAAPAFAQIETVVVTAEKRSQDIQTVPVAVSAFLSKDRDRMGITSIQDLASFTPGMTYSTSTDRVTIRGISRQTNVLSADSGVANYSDGIYQSFAVEAGRSDLDVARIEVLRGPQGTLYGRNSIGGAINIVSPRPTDEFYAEFRATYENYDHSLLEAALSGPINDDWGYRFYGNWERQGLGYAKNIIPGLPEEGNVVNTWYISGQLQGKIGNDVEVWAKAYSTAWTNGAGGPGSASGGWTPADYPTFQTAQGALQPNPGYGCSAGNGNTTVATGSVVSPLANPCANPSLTTPWKIARLTPYTVAVPGAYFGTDQWVWHTGADFDVKFINGNEWYRYVLTGPNAYSGNYPAPISQYQISGALPYAIPLGAFGVCYNAIFNPTGVCPNLKVNAQPSFNYQQQEFFTQNEVNLQSTGDSPFQWQAGLYSFLQHESQPVQAANQQQTQISTPVNAVPEGPFTLPHDVLPNRWFDDRIQFNDVSLAAYGQADYKIIPDVTLTGGVRYSYDHKYGNEMSRLVDFPIDPEYYGSFSFAYDLTPPTAISPCVIDYPGPPCNGPFPDKGVVPPGTTYNAATGFASRNYDHSSDAITGVAKIAWTPDDSTLVYGSYSRGYKGGGFNTGIFTYIVPKPWVGPEHIDAFEVGAKKTFGDWLVLDAAAYYYGYQDMQIPLAVSAAPGGVNALEFLSIPNSISEGFEFEAFLTPIEHLSVTASYSFDDGHITSSLVPGVTGALAGVSDPADPNAVVPGAKPLYTPAQCLAGLLASAPVCGIDIYTLGTAPAGVGGCPATNASCGWVIPQSLRGQRLPNAPRNKVALNVNYDFLIPNFGTLTPSVTYRWQDSAYGTIFSRFYNLAPSWDQWDVRLGFSSPDSHWIFFIYGKNIGNSIGYAQGALGARYAGTINRSCAGTPILAGGVSPLAGGVCNFVQGQTAGVATPAPPGYAGVPGESAYGTVSNYNVNPPALYGIQLQYKF